MQTWIDPCTGGPWARGPLVRHTEKTGYRHLLYHSLLTESFTRSTFVTVTWLTAPPPLFSFTLHLFSHSFTHLFLLIDYTWLAAPITDPPSFYSLRCSRQQLHQRKRKGYRLPFSMAKSDTWPQKHFLLQKTVTVKSELSWATVWNLCQVSIIVSVNSIQSFMILSQLVKMQWGLMLESRFWRTLYNIILRKNRTKAF